ncbi:hypothetical protein CTI12_AA374640 [Artemisia annua]|uniref:DUF4283 domain-containing protein n=1 Tax=Artemisia annua TaxID=35608 RepID=A0A2U1MIT8_ARTAN|nr:hypothetical protein CTI12_AA374640 [Artemisia annua]
MNSNQYGNVNQVDKTVNIELEEIGIEKEEIRVGMEDMVKKGDTEGVNGDITKIVADEGDKEKNGETEGIRGDTNKVVTADEADHCKSPLATNNVEVPVVDDQCRSPMAECTVPEHVNGSDCKSKFVEKNVSYADKLNNKKEPLDNKLFQIPTVLNENGHEFPLIMDAVTTRMCNQGVGRLGFARVLVEVNACKGLEDSIDILYKSREDGKQFVKQLKVEYDWKPPLCSYCKVFGHSFEKCLKRERTEEQVKQNKKDGEGFTQANARKNTQNKEQRNAPQQKPKEKVAATQKVYKPVEKPAEKQNANTGNNNEHNKAPQTSQGRTWNVNKEVVQVVRTTANRYSALANQEEEQAMNQEEIGENMTEKDKETVYDFVAKRKQPALEITEKWTWYEKIFQRQLGSKFSMNNFKIAAWNIRGLGTTSKQTEVKNLIWNEKISICAILKTRMKKNRIEKVCTNVFGSWQWQSNVHLSMRGCRIAVGWDGSNVRCSLIHAT